MGREDTGTGGPSSVLAPSRKWGVEKETVKKNSRLSEFLLFPNIPSSRHQSLCARIHLEKRALHKDLRREEHHAASKLAQADFDETMI